MSSPPGTYRSDSLTRTVPAEDPDQVLQSGSQAVSGDGFRWIYYLGVLVNAQIIVSVQITR